MEAGKSLRLRRFFRHHRTVIIAMDYPMYGGSSLGLEDPIKLIKTVASTEADGVIVSPWVIKRGVDSFGQLAIVARLDGGNTSLGSRVDQALNTSTVEQAFTYGAEMVAINVFIGGDNEPEMLYKLGNTAEQCEKVGLPLMAEMIPAGSLDYHFGRKSEKEVGNTNPVAISSRIGAEFGGDIIKTIFPGDLKGFEMIVQTATVPVVVAGGPKNGSDEEFLRMVESCIRAGASGITMGRNVWQRPHVEGIIAALCAIVHEDASVEKAVKLI
jgi:DhnA family fructose-bisphosphate aldolase class Ia